MVGFPLMVSPVTTELELVAPCAMTYPLIVEFPVSEICSCAATSPL